MQKQSRRQRRLAVVEKLGDQAITLDEALQVVRKAGAQIGGILKALENVTDEDLSSLVIVETPENANTVAAVKEVINRCRKLLSKLA